MNGGTFARRGLMAAAVLGGSFGAVAGFAGVAHANDHSTDVVCSDKATGAWTATMSFGSIEPATTGTSWPRPLAKPAQRSSRLELPTS